MKTELAFVGDIHGNVQALRGLWEVLARREVPHVVFLGDYINRGADSADVLHDLIAHAASGRATLLAGNHELALLDAVESRDLRGFLKMGGATTIRSYVGGRVGPDVMEILLTSLPAGHIQALRAMPVTYETQALVAQHIPPKSPTEKFCISAHVPVGSLPRITDSSADLDTGCGSKAGRLTALLWPTLGFIQVDGDGTVVAE